MDDNWEIHEIPTGQLETTVCGPIKIRYRRTMNISQEERAANMAAMEAEALGLAAWVYYGGLKAAREMREKE